MIDTIAPDDLVDGPAAATFFKVRPVTIRQWVARYGVQVRGRKGRRNLYSLSDLIDAEARANQRRQKRQKEHS